MKYLIVEDSLKTCKGIAERMSGFPGWKGCGYAHHINEAIEIIASEKPALIFLDWALKGGSAYDILQHVQKMPSYNPYIIFNTAHQKENPEIPQEIINNFRIDKYLVKGTFWEALRESLHLFLFEAKQKSIRQQPEITVLLIDIYNKKIRVNPTDIIAVYQENYNPVHKKIYLASAEPIVIKANWDYMKEILTTYEIDFFATNSKQHLVVKNYIEQFERPFVRLKKINTLKFEVVKDKLAEFERWLKM